MAVIGMDADAERALGRERDEPDGMSIPNRLEDVERDGIGHEWPFGFKLHW